ncbi:ABC transporter substrate-binding protein [Jeotgalibaca sp. MA1X17-3]|uniref:ABC transporter substrate-binding protein n=1 Tax=Jeotgalibaca sp. MA1X17-3 TaxID=2908211 RepID=UPI001F26BD22|nr:ABC transporter substrate-binding protein [Jeotgalibaca sp. MA1X17-3]UJF16437.1 ABC transporter substrate-binding protein [Jeotgalibaca sp. MA1X17-3]
MKRLTIVMTSILVVCVGLVFGIQYLNRTQGFTGDNTLTIYNWGDYIAPELLEKFEDETNYKISYETFDSNEAMYTKINQGGTAYDLTIPSEYMIERMRDEGMLQELDLSRVNGLEHIDSRFLDQAFDKGNRYSIPYFWGTLGIVYNDKFIEKEPSTWNDLWNPDYKNSLMLIDGAREIMGIGLQSEGYSLNEENPEILTRITEKLKQMTPNVKAIVADEIKMYMIQEEAAMAVTFSGEASEMLDENEHLHYVIPDEGTNIWFDNVVIPKTARNIDGAYAFINFLLDPENAAINAEYVGYSTPNADAIERLDSEITEDEQFYPSDEEIANMEVYENLGPELLGIYNDLFLEVKMFRK